ncbi:MAG: YihA family ribosome biogenesis GTP-binding protein [Bacteroidales bacterium]|nr:YihA family ribosome biogenesis GTP-binding protein [Bacteroidales bacterium]MBN2697302.1 YihA family ribosome biogenesis GTP-binding protein [Bacteroidales bacterium]
MLQKTQVRSAVFVKSSPDVSGCPEGNLPEFAFIGRSNVGKSSLINMLTGRKGLARISSTPGKTRLINHFLINDAWFLADLPGYGYARVSKKSRSMFPGLIREYVMTRQNLMCLFVLVDSRLEPQKNDLDFINWLGENRVPFAIVLTKTDKINHRVRHQNRRLLEEKLSLAWEALPAIIESSTVKKTGKEEILSFINHLVRPTENT